MTGRGHLLLPMLNAMTAPSPTLQRARDAVRVLKESKRGSIVVFVRRGTYTLSQTVVFGLADSGVGDATITYAAYPGEKPVFSSGREIKGWKLVADATSPLADRGDWKSTSGGCDRSVLCTVRCNGAFAEGTVRGLYSTRGW